MALSVRNPNIETDFDPEDPNIVRRNFRLGVINGVLFSFGESFLDPTLVLVTFLSYLTDSPILLGLLVPLRDASWSIPQFFMSNFIQRQPLKIAVYRNGAILRIIFWGMISVVITFVREPSLLLILFYIAFGLSSIASGLIGLPFLEVVSKTIPPARRGELYAWRLGLSGLMGIGASVIVRWMISPQSPLSFPYNFSLLAFAFFVFASSALVIFFGIQEKPDASLPPSRTLGAQFKVAVLELQTNPNYRRLMSANSLMQLSSAATPFFALYVQQNLGGGKEWVGIYLGVIMTANLIANLVFGRISRKKNNQVVFFTSAAAGLVMLTLVLLLTVLARPLQLTPTAASAWLIPVFFFSGIRSTGYGVSGNSLLLNAAPAEERSVIIGFSQSFLGLVLLATAVNGLLMRWFGFQTLVILVWLINLAALWQASRIVDQRDR